jgi:hypothetical protein
MTPGCYSFPPISVAPPLRAEKYKASILDIAAKRHKKHKNEISGLLIPMGYNFF